MKKILVIVICLLVIVTGCNKKSESETKEEKLTKMDEKSVVIYFSATGTTKEVANKISEVTKSDIIEIEPKEKYSDEDLDYNSDCRANKEQNDEESRPEIKKDINIDKYDTIYLGYPIWWGTNPKII